jgi:hypothetical protein
MLPPHCPEDHKGFRDRGRAIATGVRNAVNELTRTPCKPPMITRPGWRCPNCGRGVNPNVAHCDCKQSTSDDDTKKSKSKKSKKSK